jgi:hypothetical protein
MDLSFWLTTLSLCAMAYAAAQWVNSAYIAPRRAAREAQSVKRKAPRRAFKARSKGSRVQNAPNAGSGQQEAKQPSVHVQPNVQRSAVATAEPAEIAPSTTPAGDAPEREEGFTLTPRELLQLTEALYLRQEGATVEEALGQAFGVKKGASAGYVRAKALWDAATVAPGAAPAGTYQAPAPLRRKRRAVR